MLVFCSVNNRKAHRGQVYCTTMKPIGGLERLDFLAPEKYMVYGHKYHGQSDEWYTDLYWKLLWERREQVFSWLQNLSPERDETYVCYCSGGFCHTRLIAQVVNVFRQDVETSVVLRDAK